MNKLVTHDVGDARACRTAAGSSVEKESCLTIGDESPILHGTSGEVGDGNHVYGVE